MGFHGSGFQVVKALGFGASGFSGFRFIASVFSALGGGFGVCNTLCIVLGEEYKKQALHGEGSVFESA